MSSGFGYEESYGCLAGTYARDKDAPVAVMMLCEVAAYYKLKGKTLWDAMVELYEKYGYYKEDLATVTLKGIDGSQKITAPCIVFQLIIENIGCGKSCGCGFSCDHIPAAVTLVIAA